MGSWPGVGSSLDGVPTKFVTKIQHHRPQCRGVKVQSHACSSIPPSIEDTAIIINLVLLEAQVTRALRLMSFNIWVVQEWHSAAVWPLKKTKSSCQCFTASNIALIITSCCFRFLQTWASGKLSRGDASLAWQLYFIKIPFGVVIIDEVVRECIHAHVPKIWILNIKKSIALSTRPSTQCQESCAFYCRALPLQLAGNRLTRNEFISLRNRCIRSRLRRRIILQEMNFFVESLSRRRLSENECQSWSGRLLEPSVFNIVVLFQGGRQLNIGRVDSSLQE